MTSPLLVWVKLLSKNEGKIDKQKRCSNLSFSVVLVWFWTKMTVFRVRLIYYYRKYIIYTAGFVTTQTKLKSGVTNAESTALCNYGNQRVQPAQRSPLKVKGATCWKFFMIKLPLRPHTSCSDFTLNNYIFDLFSNVFIFPSASYC